MNIDVGRKLNSPVTDKYTPIPISQGYFCSISLRVCHNGEYDLPVAFDAARRLLSQVPALLLDGCAAPPGVLFDQQRLDVVEDQPRVQEC